MNKIKLTNEIVHSEKYGDVPIADLQMMTNQKELDLIEECKKKHPEFYTKEVKNISAIVD